MKKKPLLLVCLLSVTSLCKGQTANDGRKGNSFDKSWMFYLGDVMRGINKS